MSRANQKMLKFEFEALQSGLREVVWLHITVEAYFHMNLASHNDSIPKAYDQWPGFAHSYSHSVLNAIFFCIKFVQFSKSSTKLKPQKNIIFQKVKNKSN